ncbi:glycosyltransferase [Peribacillus glennii]|nr:glycosyltransferase [Peribacillus glennii]
MINEKKKVLFVNNNLVAGGVQRSLVNLIHQIKDEYEITLFVFNCSGDYAKLIPPEVKVIEASPFLKLLGMSQAQTKKMGIIFYVARAACALYTKIFSNHFPLSFLVSTQKKLSGFDVAISFLHNENEKILYGGCNEFVLKRVKAKQRITFIHCDILNNGTNTARNRSIYKYFDKIAAVSEGCRRNFIKAVPELEEKTYCVYNCHNFSEYYDKSIINPIEYPLDCLNIVTVARLSPEKGIIRGISIIKRLIKENYRIRWHIIGGGPQRSEIEKEILNNNLSEHIILYGNQENPYRYIKNADVFLLPSIHEAAPMVFEEAKFLGVPIITTNTISAREMIREGKEGIVSGNNEEELYNSLRRVVDQPAILQKYKEYLRIQNFSNETAIKQFSNLI